MITFNTRLRASVNNRVISPLPSEKLDITIACAFHKTMWLGSIRPPSGAYNTPTSGILLCIEKLISPQ